MSLPLGKLRRAKVFGCSFFVAAAAATTADAQRGYQITGPDPVSPGLTLNAPGASDWAVCTSSVEQAKVSDFAGPDACAVHDDVEPHSNFTVAQSAGLYGQNTTRRTPLILYARPALVQVMPNVDGTESSVIADQGPSVPMVWPVFDPHVSSPTMDGRSGNKRLEVTVACPQACLLHADVSRNVGQGRSKTIYSKSWSTPRGRWTVQVPLNRLDGRRGHRILLQMDVVLPGRGTPARPGPSATGGGVQLNDKDSYPGGENIFCNFPGLKVPADVQLPRGVRLFDHRQCELVAGPLHGHR